MATATASSADTMSPTSLTSLIQNAAISSESPIPTEALADKQVASYIRSLSNFSLADLKTQPQQLQSKSEALHQQLSELCISQTDAFIHIHHAEQQFAPSLSTFATHLDDLLQNTLPDLQAAADAFVSASQPVLAERERVRNVADQYERGHLSDLLEIPPLVQTCVKAGHHSEAIQLAEHLVQLLKRSHEASTTASTSVTLHGQRSTHLSLLIETLAHLASMKADLVSSFSKSGLKLPAALKSVTVLRRLNHFESSLPDLPDWQLVLASAQSDASSLAPQLGMSENQLCLAFLKARIHSFHSALDAMGSPSSFSSEAYLRRCIDLWREEMADTLGMAFPLFIDEAQSKSTGDETGPDMVTPAYLVSSFATSGLQRLRDTISAQLVTAVHRVQSASPASSGSTASLETLADTFANIHTQLSYASAALTRFGLDFGPLLFAPSDAFSPDADPSTRSLGTLETTWLDALTHSLDHIFAHTHTQLDEHLHAAHDGATLPSQWLISSQLPTSALEDLYRPTAHAATYDDATRPNIELVDYPVLARLLNRLLEWLHALQAFAPVTLASVLLRRLDERFARITQRLLAEVPEAIARIHTVTPAAQRLLADDEAQAALQHLEDDVETKRKLELQIVRERESAVLGRVVAMWHGSVVVWTLDVVRGQIFDVGADGEGGATAAEEVWGRAQQWISKTNEQAAEANKTRRQDASARKKAVEEAEAKARAEAEEEAKRQAEEEAKIKAEEEARAKAEEEARLKAEAEARRQAEEAARLKAEEEARLKAQEEERLQAEAEAKAKAEAEAKAKAEAEAVAKAKLEAEAQEKARLEAEQEAKRKAEEEAKIEAEATAKAKREAKEKAEQEAKAKAEADAEEAKAEAEAEAKAKLEEEARVKADEAAKANAAKDEAEEQAKEDVDTPSKTDTSTEEAVTATEQPAPSTAAATAAAAPKKFSLADKLRQRKEERDRAAAAAASTKSTEAQPPQDESKDAAADAEPTKSNESDQAKATQQNDSQPPTEAVSKEDEEKEPPTAPTDHVDAVDDGAQATAQEAAAEDGENDDDEAAEGEGSGDNTPATPTTPNLDSTSGGGASKKSKKNNKNKKK